MHAAPLANRNEVLVNGGFFDTGDTDFGNVNLDFSYGRYLGHPAWQIGLLQGLNWTIVDDAGGFKFFLTDHAFVQTKYRYEWFFDELNQTDGAADDGNHVLSLGIGYVWGGV